MGCVFVVVLILSLLALRTLIGQVTLLIANQFLAMFFNWEVVLSIGRPRSRSASLFLRARLSMCHCLRPFVTASGSVGLLLRFSLLILRVLPPLVKTINLPLR